MAYTTPIFDRTYEDAVYALTHQAEAGDLKGAVNISDLQRIEDNTQYLHDILGSYGYTTNITPRASNWTMNDLLYVEDLDRFKQNLLNIMDGYYTYTGTPVLLVGQTTIDYTILNDVEKVIYYIYNMTETMINSFRYCGDYTCGQDLNTL